MSGSAEALSGKRILITGATGLVGSNLVRRLAGAGIKAWILARPTSSLLRLEEFRDRVAVVEGDLRDQEAIGRIIAETGPDVVFHLATTIFNPPVLSAVDHFGTNALGMLHLLEALKVRPEVRFIFSGSAAVYGSGAGLREDDPIVPGTVFGASKAACSTLGQTYRRLYGLDFVELRIFSAFGPWERSDRLIPYVILKALSGEPVDIGNGAPKRDWVYVEDVVDALIAAATADIEPGLTVNISSGTGYSVQAVAESILQGMGNPVELRIGVRETRRDEIWEISGDPAAAFRKLGWKVSTSLERGIEQSVKWFTENRELAWRLT